MMLKMLKQQIILKLQWETYCLHRKQAEEEEEDEEEIGRIHNMGDSVHLQGRISTRALSVVKFF